MQRIPGAIIVVAGAALLAATSLTSPPDVYGQINLLAGLLLCAFGLVAASVGNTTSSIVQQTVRVAWLHVSIRDLVWLAVVASLAAAWWVDHQNLTTSSGSGPCPTSIIPVVG
jgi:hypothetical protein